MGLFETEDEVARRGSRAERREVYKQLTRGQDDARVNMSWNTWFIETLVQARVLGKVIFLDTDMGVIRSDQIYALAPDWVIIDTPEGAQGYVRQMIARTQVRCVLMKDLLSPDAYENGESLDDAEGTD